MRPARRARPGAAGVAARAAVQGLGTLALAWTCAAPVSAELLLATPTLAETLPVRSWKNILDDRIVKQNLDYSCGAAALATILQSFYGVKASEEELLAAMDKEAAASFADMARVLPRFGFKAVGVTLGFGQLQQLKIPVLLHLHHRDQDHFSVFRGSGKEVVWLADPSWGNRRLTHQAFLAMWAGPESEAASGKALLVLPLAATAATSDFFARPADFSLPIGLLPLRGF